MKLDPVIEWQLAVYEALRRIGFTPEEIFVSWAKEIGPISVLRAEGKQFVIRPEGPACSLTPEEYSTAWIDAAGWWNRGATDEERLTIYRTHFTEDVLAHLISALGAAGLPLRDSRASQLANWTNNTRRSGDETN